MLDNRLDMAGSLNFMAALLAMKRALMGKISRVTSKLFCRRVVPVSTMSTITSLRPSNGASSMEPLSLMISISRLCAA